MENCIIYYCRVGTTESGTVLSLYFKELFTLHSFFEMLRLQKGQILRPSKISCLWPSKWNWMIKMILWLPCLSNNSFAYKQFFSKFIFAAFNKYTLTSIILQLRNDLHTYYIHHIKKKRDKPNKINVNLARTWFHFICVKHKIPEWQFSPFFVILSENISISVRFHVKLLQLCETGVNSLTHH